MLDSDYLDRYSACLAELSNHLGILTKSVGENFATTVATLSTIVQEAEGQRYEVYVTEFNHVLVQSTAKLYMSILQGAQQHVLTQLMADYPDVHTMSQERLVVSEQGAQDENI